MKLPEDLIEAIRIATDNENDSKMLTVFAVGEQWSKYKEAIIYNYADENGLDQPDEDKARGWFLHSLSGNLANTAYSTLCNRMRVWRNVIERGLYEGNEIITAPVWVYLMRNLPHENGLVELEGLKERVEWYYNEGMPTVRTIEEYVKKNGKSPEWRQVWDRIVNAARKFLELEGVPADRRGIVQKILWELLEQEEE